MSIRATLVSAAFRLLAPLAAAGCIAASSHAAPVIMVGETDRVSVGDTFEVAILVADAFDLKSFQFDLGFDETKLALLSFTDAGTAFEQAALTAGGFLLGMTGFQLPGLLSGAADSMIGVSDGMAGAGAVAILEFQALSSGLSGLTLSNVYLDGTEVSADAIFSGRAEIPEPPLSPLLALGLAILAAIQAIHRRAVEVHLDRSPP